jgi:hypothetical protein
VSSFSPRDHLRAIAIAVVLIVHGYIALPIPSTVNAKQFNNPIAKDELDRWVGILGKRGVVLTRAELQAEVIERAKGITTFRKSSLEPIKPINRVTGTGQAWGLFTYPNSFPHTMYIELEIDGAWQPLYTPLDPEHDWNKRLFVFRRIRGVYDDNATNTRQSYENFVDWVSGMALEEHPQATAVRIYYRQGHVTLPGEEKDPETKLVNERIRTREDLQ